MIYHQYLIIGAGPGGLQLGYYLQKYGMDYLILERNEKAGSFFEKFPRHRKLISINKQTLGELGKRRNVDHNEVRLRFDWNSLLSDESSPMFTEYSREYFPPADRVVDYFRDYADQHELKIRYQTEIVKISTGNIEEDIDDENIDDESDIACNYILEDTDGQVYGCGDLIIATGLFKPYLPTDFPGIKLATGYEEMSMNLDDYWDKTILILGKGNSAYETANYLTPVAGSINMVARHAAKFAWETHFVGDLRAVNNDYLDTYQLKSLGVSEDWDDNSICRRNGKYYLRSAGHVPYDIVIRCLGWQFDDKIFQAGGLEPELFLDKLPRISADYQSTNLPHLYFTGVLAQSRDYKKSTTAFIHGFRYVSRFLANHLALINHQREWPKQTLSLTSWPNSNQLGSQSINQDKLPDLVKAVLETVNESSSIFQLFHHYCHVIVFREQTANLYMEMPLDYLNQWDELKDHDFLIITMEYGFEKDEDVFNYSFVQYDGYNGYRSKFIHPVIRYYPANEKKSSIQTRLERKNTYLLCHCGRWEKEQQMKTMTICRKCQALGICLCGQQAPVSRFEHHLSCTDKCSRQMGSNFRLNGVNREIADDFVRDDIGTDAVCFEHHITEDIHNDFVSNSSRHNLTYSAPLYRFLRTVQTGFRENTINYYLDRWQQVARYHLKDPELLEQPVQFRFWTFNSHLILKNPKRNDVGLVAISPRFETILNRPPIKQAVQETLELLYGSDRSAGGDGSLSLLSYICP